jgi:sugar phosphate isomerase/epimerase
MAQASEYGRSARWYNNYDAEIEFCKKNGFGFMQIWYINGKLKHDTLPDPVEKAIFEANFPIIVHAHFTIEDYAEYSEDLLRILKHLKHKEVIIHPFCEPSSINRDTIYKLSEYNKKITDMFFNEKITVYIENNAKTMPLIYEPEELRLIFNDSPKTELLLDIAHIGDYAHLQELINIKYPKMLHISDRYLSSEHEHLPIGRGDINFELIFSKYLSDFTGKVILEIPEEDNIIIDSMAKIKKAVKNIKYEATLKSAMEYAALGNIEEWLQKYLCGEGANRGLAEGLKLEEREYTGPVLMSLDLFGRGYGPEPGMKFSIREDDKEQIKWFWLNIGGIMERYRAGKWDMPPLIIEEYEGEYELSDGNHRLEALKMLGIKEYWVILWRTK